MQHAIQLLLVSELFRFYHERMVGLIMVDAQEVRAPLGSPMLTEQNTNPHELYILYHIILFYGKQHPSLFRSHRKWRKLLPTLAEVVGLDADEVRAIIRQQGNG